MDEQDLLHVRIPVPLLRPDDHDYGVDDRAVGVLLALRGELPVALAGVCRSRYDGRLRVLERTSVLGHSSELWWSDGSGALCGLLSLDWLCGVYPDWYVFFCFWTLRSS